MRTQAEKGEIFRGLHHREAAFVLPNPWDVGTAKLLAGLGFVALATTSAGYAVSLGKRDGEVGREAMMQHVAAVAAATDLPVNGDLENGFGDAPETVAETIQMAAAAGLVGASIEDATGRPDDPIYAIEFAAERVRAAAEVARSLDFPFTLTARAENYLHGHANLGDTIRRLQAFQQAGADVLYAPGLVEEADIAAVVSAVDRPVNVLMAMPGLRLDLAGLSRLGVKRVSTGSLLTKVAMGALLRAGRELLEAGTFGCRDGAAGSAEIERLLGRR